MLLIFFNCLKIITPKHSGRDLLIIQNTMLVSILKFLSSRSKNISDYLQCCILEITKKKIKKSLDEFYKRFA